MGALSACRGQSDEGAGEGVNEEGDDKHSRGSVPVRTTSMTMSFDREAREKAVYLAKLAEQAERYDGTSFPLHSVVLGPR